MIYIDLKTTATHRLSFYLAMEEYVARSVYAGEDCFFMWQVEPTVIFGRNQAAENEVDLAYCRTEGIDVFRRKSGGGCVYADMSNVMLSYITREDDLTEAFDHYLALLTAALQRIGIPAVRNDHNDVMLGGHKISGNAIWHLPGRTIAHGTLLYDTRMEHMTRAITPGKQKLDKNGVQSVAQRITLLKDYTTLSLEDIKRSLRNTICDKTHCLTEADEDGIRLIEREYLDPQFIYGK